MQLIVALRIGLPMSTNVMKSLRFTEFGPPSVSRNQEAAIPEPSAGEALVQVKAAAINPSDLGNVAGRFKSTTLPRPAGPDFAGIAVKGMHDDGAEVWGSSWKLGIVRDGSHAEYVVVPGETFSLKPKSLSMDLRERVLELTAGKGVDAVFGTVGGKIFESALRPLRLLGVDSVGLTSRQTGQIEEKLLSGFETGALKPPPIEIVPFEKAVDAYSRVAAGQTKAKQVLSFDWRDGQRVWK